MKRILIICLCIMGLSACKKSDSLLKQSEAQAIVDDNIVLAYIKANGLTAQRVKISATAPDTCGVWYVVSNPGSGTTLYTNSTSVTAGFTARELTTAKVFQQTGTFHPSFVFQQMIRGWQLGIPQIKKGGIVRLLVTSRFAYGPYEQSTLGLPANAVLDFDIELFDVKN